MSSHKKAFTAVAAAIAALTACSGSAPTVEPATNTPAESSPLAPAPVTPTTATATPTQTTRAAKFGDTVTFNDGTKVKVTSGGFMPVEPSALDAVEGRAAVIVLAVTAGTQEIDAGTMDLLNVRVGPTGKPVNKVYSSELGNESLTTILPGETQTVRIGYGIRAADAKDVRVEVDGPSYDDRPAIFRGAIS